MRLCANGGGATHSDIAARANSASGHRCQCRLRQRRAVTGARRASPFRLMRRGFRLLLMQVVFMAAALTLSGPTSGVAGRSTINVMDQPVLTSERHRQSSVHTFLEHRGRRLLERRRSFGSCHGCQGIIYCQVKKEPTPLNALKRRALVECRMGLGCGQLPLGGNPVTSSKSPVSATSKKSRCWSSQEPPLAWFAACIFSARSQRWRLGMRCLLA